MFNRLGLLLGIAAALALAPALSAQTSGVAERYSFVTTNAPDASIDGKDRLLLTITRWSTDEERDRVVKTVSGDPATLLEAFRNVSGVGYVRWPGGLEYTLRYARQSTRPDGMVDVSLVVDRPIWVWWDSSQTHSLEPPYSVIQLRLTTDGTGDGRISAGTGIAADKEVGVVLADDDTRPVLIRDVRRERTDS